MRRILITAAILCIPGALTIAGPIAVAVVLLRRRKERNRVMVIKPPVSPILRVMNGGKS